MTTLRRGERKVLLVDAVGSGQEPDRRVTAVRTGEKSAVAFFDPEVSSALNASRVADGRAVGGAAVFERARR